jgi:hypothetical protein
MDPTDLGSFGKIAALKTAEKMEGNTSGTKMIKPRRHDKTIATAKSPTAKKLK